MINQLGILTGISYVSGLDYYKGINERVLVGRAARHVMPPNPRMVMVSVDCDQYAHYLMQRAFDQAAAYLLEGIAQLVTTGCDCVVIASNTGHLCVPAVETAYPDLKLLHIADCSAYRLKQRGFRRVGLVGTQISMEESYLHDRLARHGITTIVPEEEEARQEIFRIIREELSFNRFEPGSRQTIIKAMRALSARGAEACISGCTEIELLVQQPHIPDLPLLPSAETHIETIAALLLGKIEIDDLLPPASILSP